MIRSSIAALAALAASTVLLLSACGGGGGSGPSLSPNDIAQLRSDPRLVRAESILRGADTLLLPALHLDFSVSAQGRTVSDSLAYSGRCSGMSCVLTGHGQRGTFTVRDLAVPVPHLEWERAELGSRGGFDTLVFEGSSDLAESLGSTVGDATFSATGIGYGLWGEHGVAMALLVDAPFSGRSNNVPFTGQMDIATAYVIGDAAERNPSGLGGATWRGIAEAISTSSYKRRQGTATVRISDLSRPVVDVEVNIGGSWIGSSAWNDIPLHAGRYSTGSNGYDRLVGAFYGSSHQETYGAFDTRNYVGVFGALRE